jgi:hypothetical protein
MLPILAGHAIFGYQFGGTNNRQVNNDTDFSENIKYVLMVKHNV